MIELKQRLIQGLAKSTTEERNHWAHQILDDNINIEPFLDLLLAEPSSSTRFSWLLGDLVSMSTRHAVTVVKFCLANLDQISIPDIKRVILKQCAFLDGVFPPEIEGKVLSRAFEWLEDPTSSISTKEMAIKTLCPLTSKHPEIKPEFKTVLEACLPSQSSALDRKIKKTISSL